MNIIRLCELPTNISKFNRSTHASYVKSCKWMGLHEDIDVTQYKDKK